MFWGLSVHRGCNCLYNSLTDDLRVVSALWFIIMQPTCFCSVSGTSRFSSALKLEKFLWFSITVCQPWGLQEYSEGGKVRWVLNGWSWSGLIWETEVEFISPSRQLRPPSGVGTVATSAATIFWPQMNIHNLCYKLLLASFPGSEANLKRPLRCISLIIDNVLYYLWSHTQLRAYISA